MHSFTFSSERAPKNNSRAVLLLSFLCSVIFLCLIEYNWRISGAHPEYIDSKARWAHERDKLTQSNDRDRTAILGDSRMLYDFSANQFTKKIRHVALAQLAIAATQPYAVLKDIANEPTFDGIIILSFSPLMLLDSSLNEQQSWVDYFKNRWTPANRANFFFSDYIDPWIASRQSYYGLRNTLSNLIKRQSLPTSPLLVSIAENRNTDADYRRVNIEEHLAHVRATAEHLFPSVTPQDLLAWRNNFLDFKRLIDHLKMQGARIVLVKLPTEGTWHRLETSKFPQQQYWENVLTQLEVPGLDFQYLVTNKSLHLPDSLHLDQSQKAIFTDNLIEKLLEIGYY